MPSRLLLLLLVVAAGAARPALADDCDDMTLVDSERVVFGAPAPVDVLIPCAAVDNGDLGSDCPEVWAVNHQGTLLCRVALLAIGVDHDRSAVQRVDGNAAGGAPFFAAALCPGDVASPALPLIVGVLPRAAAVGDRGPAEAHLFEQPRPS